LAKIPVTIAINQFILKYYNDSKNLSQVAPAGNAAATSMPGTGIFFWAAKKTQVYDNELLNQAFPLVMVSFLTSYDMAKDKEYVPIAASEQARMEVAIEEETSIREDIINQRFETDKNFRPYNEEVVIGKNTYSFGPFRKKIQSDASFGLAMSIGFKDAHIWFDGVKNPKGSTLCVEDKQNIVLVDLDYMNGLKDVGVRKIDDYVCDPSSKLTIN